MVCQGDAVTLIASGANSYTWSFSTGTLNGAILTTTLLSPGSYTVTASDPNNNCINKSVLLVGTDACLGLSFNKVYDFTIYPNPFQDKVKISSRTAFSFGLHDIHGRLIYSSEGFPGINSINFSVLKEGTYFLVIQLPEGIINRKIVKLVSD
jgi:hypothetical protein